jgi:hypothetical protein
MVAWNFVLNWIYQRWPILEGGPFQAFLKPNIIIQSKESVWEFLIDFH